MPKKIVLNHVLPQKPSVMDLNSEVCEIPDIDVSEPIRLAAKKVAIIHDNFLAETTHVLSNRVGEKTNSLKKMKIKLVNISMQKKSVKIV